MDQRLHIWLHVGKKISLGLLSFVKKLVEKFGTEVGENDLLLSCSTKIMSNYFQILKQSKQISFRHRQEVSNLIKSHDIRRISITNCLIPLIYTNSRS